MARVCGFCGTAASDTMQTLDLSGDMGVLEAASARAGPHKKQRCVLIFRRAWNVLAALGCGGDVVRRGRAQ